jgi:hypothetical protein
MMVNWDRFLEEIRSFPPNVHKLRPPCPTERLREEESRFGTLPSDLVEMLRRFNGGELFVDAIPFLTLFGLSVPDDPKTSDWFIDRFTPTWRSELGEPTDWVIGMTNYGGLSILGQDLFVKEWDTSQRKWTSDDCPLNQWVERLLIDGAAYLEES